MLYFSLVRSPAQANAFACKKSGGGKTVEKDIRQLPQLCVPTDGISHGFRIPSPDWKTVQVLMQHFPFLLIEELFMLASVQISFWRNPGMETCVPRAELVFSHQCLNVPLVWACVVGDISELCHSRFLFFFLKRRNRKTSQQEITTHVETLTE